MEEIRHEIKNHDMEAKWTYLSESWDSHLSHVDAILVKSGVEDEDAIKLKTLAIQEWLFRYEFINTILIITKDLIIFFGSKEQASLLNLSGRRAIKNKKKIVVVEKTKELYKEEMDALFKEIKRAGINIFGIFSKEVQKGNLIDQIEKRLKEDKFEQINVSGEVQQIISVKLSQDLKAIKSSAKITNHFFKLFVEFIEGVVDDNTEITHLAISENMEELLEKSGDKIQDELKEKSYFFDFAYSPIIQSGKVYNLKPNAECTNDNISFDCILLNMAGKYFGLNCNVFRTLLINPTQRDKNNYSALYKIHNKVMKSIKEGRVFNEIYKDAMKYCKSNYKDLIDHLPSNFGFGIGYEFKESCLLINKKNERKVKRGNVLTVITSLKDLTGFKERKKYSMHLADTVMVDNHGNVINLTEENPSNFEDIGYKIEDNKTNNRISNERESSDKKISRTGRKRQNIEVEHRRRITMKKNQKKQLDLKMKELMKKVEDGFFEELLQPTKKIDLEKVKAYSERDFPINADRRKIHVDYDNFCILLPFNKQLFPFHVMCLKNVSTSIEDDFMKLRVNFITPAVANTDIAFPTIESFGSSPIYIKELTFRSKKIDEMKITAKQIKELIKKFKLKSKLSDLSIVNNRKELLKTKLVTLDDIYMRPSLAGKKSVGYLTSYANGFKFVSKKNDIFEIFLSNIKHAIFKPSQDDAIVAIYLDFFNPMVINKKLQKGAMFFITIGEAVDKTYERKSKRPQFNEYEEEEIEQKETEKWNKRFSDFVSYTEKNWKKDKSFEMPYSEFGFLGFHSSDNVYALPTANCLVSLVETPFVITLDDIEIVSIERLSDYIKTFDIVIIFKDYTKPVFTINNIPKESLDTIKLWLK